MNDTSRLIEHAFPLKQASLDSVHEKNVRHGHISTLHIWPARRPLAACRAALLATLLPDPGTPEKRKALCERIGGKLVKNTERKKMPDGSTLEREKEETVGGILHWGRETKNAADLEWFRKEILKAYGGQAPKVLDPFAGGGAIPLEAMRLGCETTAVDINPVAWFVEKCTLQYPQQLAGKTIPLPAFVLEDEAFMDDFYEAHPHLVGRTKKTKKQVEAEAGIFPEWVKDDSGRAPKADLAWQVRAWGRWVLKEARKELGNFYPTYAEFEPLDRKNPLPYERLAMSLVPLNKEGNPDIEALNKKFSPEYLEKPGNPRWIAKPTVAYLWARTVTCKNCRCTLPLLKTLWLCKRPNKRVLLSMEPNADRSGVVFGVELSVPAKGGNAAQKREHDKRLAAGTMSRSGAKCPCCGTIMTMEDIRVEGKAGRLSQVLTCVITEDTTGKIYRLPTPCETEIALKAELLLPEVFANLPYGELTEPTPKGGNGASRAFSVQNYGWDQWRKLFSPRQLLVLGTLAKQIRIAGLNDLANLESEWRDAIVSYLALLLDKTADYGSMVCTWHNSGEKIGHTFARFALPITWDNAELAILNDVGGSLMAQLDWIARYIDHALIATVSAPPPRILNQSSTVSSAQTLDAIITDPPYYDAIPYSDCMDFFYVWLRRSLGGVLPSVEVAFKEPLSPKWNKETNDGELIDDSSRHGGNATHSKQVYEDGMARVFQTCHTALKPEGRLVIVFAHKHPDAWETLVSAIIRAGFVVDGSWPIQTEMGTRMRAMGAAALSSSVWLVCRKRPATAKPGWDAQVLEEMRTNIRDKLREFWDAGIRGPDFVWAATGPAMEAYSRHPVVRKANEPGPLAVSEFLTHVRRMVVDFVVGRVLSGDKEGEEATEADRLDEITAYYLLHRHDFGMDEAPAGACILYAVSCGLSDRELAATWDLLSFTKGKDADADNSAEADADDDSDGEEDDSGGKVKLKTWAQRKGKYLGLEAPGGRPIPLIDRVHCLMHLWKAGDLSKVDGYLDANGLRRQELFKRLLQSLIELSPHGSEERSLLESLSNHVGARGAVQTGHLEMPLEERPGKVGGSGEEE